MIFAYYKTHCFQGHYLMEQHSMCTLLLQYADGSSKELVLSDDEHTLAFYHETELCAISGEMPASLRIFKVHNSPILTQLPAMPASLQSIELWSCHALMQLPEMPASLQKFHVTYCNGLMKLPEMPVSLQSFYLEKCPALSQQFMESLSKINSDLCQMYGPLGGHLLTFGVRKFLECAGLGLTKKLILSEPNVELRRRLIEQYGWREFMLDASAAKINEDDFGTLYRLELNNDHPLTMVKVVNSTPEADGSFKDYYLMVDSQLRPMWIDDETDEVAFGEPQELTARNAVASTFGLRGEEYSPEVET